MSTYLTVEEANEYIKTHYLSTDTLRKSWEALSDEDKTVLLTVSTEAIDSYPWPGRKALASQEHAFPRYPYIEVPKAVLFACIENAATMSDSTKTADIDTYRKMWAYGVSSYSIGNYSETIVQGGGSGGASTFVPYGVLSDKAQTLLRPFMGGGYCIE